MKSGAEQLRIWRAKRGFNQAESAAHLGFDVAYLSKLENGKQVPGLGNALRIERLTGIPVEAWVTTELDIPPTDPGAGDRNPNLP